MPTLANDLVRFLMNLFGDQEAVQDFLDNPERALSAHGLGNVGSADVDAAMPVVLDYAPITVDASSFERSYHTDSNGAWAGQARTEAGPGAFGPGNASANYDNDDHAYAVQQLHHVVHHFTYTTNTIMVDERATSTRQSDHQNIWATGDVEQWFDHDAVAASNDHAAAGGDHALAAGGYGSSGNEQSDTSYAFTAVAGFDVDDSFSEDVDDSNHADQSQGTDPDLGGSHPYSYGDNSSHDFVAADDSLHPGTSTTTAGDAHVDNPFQDNPATSFVDDNQASFMDDNPTHTDTDLDPHHTIDESMVDGTAGV